MRILAAHLILLALLTVVSVVTIRQVLLVWLDQRVQESLVQEVEEFRRLARGIDPSSGRAFGSDTQAIFDTYLDRNVTGEGEALITILDGEFYDATLSSRAAPLDDDPALIARWARLSESQRGEVATPRGPARYLAVPIAGGGPGDVFVVAYFVRGERAEVDEAVKIAALTALGVLVLASILAFFSAGRVLAPVRVLTETARSINDSDLTRRIPVQGHDELADLATTFNEMLDRLDTAFHSQRAFVRDASHELRTPITIVRGHLELMGDDPADRRETVELVMDELDRMTRFVEDMLLLAQSDRPDFLQPEPVELGVLQDELFAKARGLAPRDWRLEGRGSGALLADRQRLTQAMMSLADNAVQHTTEGDRIVIGGLVDHGQARLWVSDSGPGVPLHEQSRIFERFARVDGRRRSSGAGLGLAIVRAIAESHGGRVEVRSRPGAGATFTLVLPAYPSAGAEGTVRARTPESVTSR